MTYIENNGSNLHGTWISAGTGSRPIVSARIAARRARRDRPRSAEPPRRRLLSKLLARTPHTGLARGSASRGDSAGAPTLLPAGRLSRLRVHQSGISAKSGRLAAQPRGAALQGLCVAAPPAHSQL